MLDIAGSFYSYVHRMLEKGIRLCSKASWLGVFGMDFFLGHARGEIVPCSLLRRV